LLSKVRNEVSGRTEHDARAILTSLRDTDVQEIFEHGIHEYLAELLTRINQLALDISANFLVPIEATEDGPERSLPSAIR